ncbi:hypothetical protein [Methanobrevibacter sp.]|uniref:hypothetical protein n=1 Tax=Methanobrevibacter sp. TaxID=66852 RepID=UPI0025E81ABC|nr:hypothetical protein [Methanobrevibacter sp.]MBQ2961884.1 hypothetical protein [Methanobrevibacter sp.]
MARGKNKKLTKKEEKELNEKVDKIIEKNFADFSSQDELENFIQDAFNEKTSKYNKNLKKKEKEINKKVSKVYKTDNKRIDRKIKELDKKINARFKNI